MIARRAVCSVSSWINMILPSTRQRAGCKDECDLVFSAEMVTVAPSFSVCRWLRFYGAGRVQARRICGSIVFFQTRSTRVHPILGLFDKVFQYQQRFWMVLGRLFLWPAGSGTSDLSLQGLANGVCDPPYDWNCLYSRRQGRGVLISMVLCLRGCIIVLLLAVDLLEDTGHSHQVGLLCLL